MNSSTPSQSPSPCGCGGAHASSSTSGCGCGCGGQCGCGPADCRDGGAIVRPRFFAGQLLTEEDLQALSEYVAAKSRLHNRDFFGEGVTCGFEVVCHPCCGGKVIVRPGHALDCCGNDVVLSTAQTLDVNALVRELRKTLQGGIDCGDPCADPAHSGGPQRYGLFVRYCETLTEPVSAFVTDEPCGTAACEPTRVREGLRFELRCREKADPPKDALCRIATCLGDPLKLNAVLAEVTALDHVISQSEEGLELERQDGEYKPTEMTQSTEALVAATALPPTGRNLRNLVARVDVVRVHLDRFNRLAASPTVPTEISAAGDALDAAAIPIVDHLDTGASTGLEKSFTRRVVELAEVAINQATHTTHDLWKDKVEQIPKLTIELDVMLCSLLDLLRSRLDGTPEVTVCELSREVRDLAILCPRPPAPREFSKAIGLARQLRDAAWHSLQECICPALLPPCPECHDAGVLLASLEVQSCEVVRICNLERTIVATPIALRHWLPLRELQQIAAALCCRDLGHLELKQLFDSLCPSTTDLTKLASAFRQLSELIREHEPQGLPFFQSLPAAPAPAPVAATQPEPAAPAAVGRLEAAQKKNATDLEKAQGDLEGLRNRLAEQTKRNDDLEKRLKALEGRKKP